MPNSRNFTYKEITRSRPVKGHEYHAYFMMGWVQGARDYLSMKYGREIPLTVTSADRSNYNSSVPNAAGNSYHEWREAVYKNRKQFCTAVDVRSSALSAGELYNALDGYVRGELYWNKGQDIVHMSPFGINERFIVGMDGKTMIPGTYRKKVLQ